MNSVKSLLWPVEGKLGQWEKISYHYASQARPQQEHRPCGCLFTTFPQKPARLQTHLTAILDQSTGKLYKNDSLHLIRFNATLATLFTPVHAVAAIALNLLRIVLAPLYFGGQAVVEGDPVKAFRGWRRLSSHSLINCLRAVFYGLACTLAGLYTIFDPINGRKIYGSYEFAWNREIPVEKAIHIFIPRNHFQMKHPFHGDNAYYLPGCFQPIWRFAKASEQTYEQYHQDLSEQVSRALTSVQEIQGQLRANLMKISEEILVPGSGWGCFHRLALTKERVNQFPEYVLDQETLDAWSEQFEQLKRVAAYHKDVDPKRREFETAWMTWRSLCEQLQSFQHVDEQCVIVDAHQEKLISSSANAFIAVRKPLRWILC